MDKEDVFFFKELDIVMRAKSLTLEEYTYLKDQLNLFLCGSICFNRLPIKMQGIYDGIVKRR